MTWFIGLIGPGIVQAFDEEGKGEFSQLLVEISYTAKIPKIKEHCAGSASFESKVYVYEKDERENI